MKKQNSKTKTVGLPKEMEILQRKILDDVLLRDRLEKELKENPDKEKEVQIARLSKEIEENQRVLGAFAFPGLLEGIDEACENLIKIFANFDERVFLEPENDGFVAGIIQTLIAMRNQFYDYQRHFFPNEDVLKVINCFEEKISRAKQIVEEKRKSVAKSFPGLAAHLKEPEFEMPDEYNKTLDSIMEMVEKRDEAKKNIKYAAPEKRKQAVAAITEMDRLLNEAEEVLARHYERFQKKQRWLDGLRKMFKEASQSELNSMREHLKENPGEFPEMEKLMAEEFPE